MIKKMLLVASAIAAFAAFAIPAAAQATEYHEFYHHGGGTITEDTTIEGLAELTSVANGVFATGPAEVDIHGFVNNEEGMGVGVLDIVHATAPETGIPTNLPGCVATSATTSTFEGTEGRAEEYPLTIETPDVLVISNVTFTNHYNNVCQEKFGVPATVSATGSVTGTIISPECVEFNTRKDHLFTEHPITHAHLTEKANVDLLGEACFVGATFG